MKQIKAYQCEFCGFYKKTKQSVNKHEDYCYHNPKNRACATCDHNLIDYDNVQEVENGQPISYNYCKSRNVQLHNKTLRMNCNIWHSDKNK